MRPDRPARLGAPSPLRAILQVTSGNFLEMFDFFLFGFFAKPIGDAFFPVADDVGRLLLALVTFGAGFLMRPLGAVVLGAYIDRVGRRRGLIVTLAVMATGTVLIALTPGYRSFAAVSPSLTYAAPMLVLVGRLAQGFSAGVELGGVSVYLAEMAPPGRKGFFASWQSGSQQVAIVVAATLGVALETALAPDEIAAWGWRLPFLVGCSIVPLLFVLRRRLEETDEFKARTMRPSAREALRTLADNWRIVGLGTGMVAFTTVSFYVITVYAPTFGRQVLRLAATDTLLVTIAVGAANFVWLPIAGALSDRIGRKPILVAATAAALCTSYPAMTWLAASPSFTRMLTVELWLSLLFAAYNGAMIVALTEIVPVDVRTSGFSLAYSLATAVFGGFTPAISQELVRALADKAAPALWMSVAAAISLAAVLVVYRSPPTSSRPAPSTPTRRAPPS